MSFLEDVLPITKKKELFFIGKIKETNDVYTFVFQKPLDLNWKAGQHGIFHIVHKKIKNPTRPFSVASAPSEKDLRVSMKIGESPSEFKQAMMELEPGMKIAMRGPVGPLYLKENRPSLMLAGGIGITPFRSILKEVEMKGKEGGKNIRLLYLDSQSHYLYHEELDEVAKNTSLELIYLNDREQFYKEIDQFVLQRKETGQYFVGGPKPMVDSVSNYLKKKRIHRKNIKKDAFFGYN